MHVCVCVCVCVWPECFYSPSLTVFTPFECHLKCPCHIKPTPVFAIFKGQGSLQHLLLQWCWSTAASGRKTALKELVYRKANMYLTFLDRRNNKKWILNPSSIRFTSSSTEYWKIKQLICFSSTTAINAHHWVDGVSFFFFFFFQWLDI